MVICLPIPTLIKLKRQRPEIKQLLGLILLGLVHTGLTVARFVIMFYPDPLTKTEPQYTHIMPNCLAVVEMDVGIWVATLVVMRPAFHALHRRFFPDYTPKKPRAMHYGSSGNGKIGEKFTLQTFNARNTKREDELHILETKDIYITSEDAEANRI
jgi:hypothetical protein